MNSSAHDVTSPVASATSALSAKDIFLTYPNGIQALAGASVSVAPGEFLALIGPNGSGKSSLLRAMAGLQAVDSGAITLDGAPIDGFSSAQRASQVALVPQGLELAPGYRVFDFVLLGRFAHLRGWRLFGAEDYRIARASLERVDAWEFKDRAMDQLSGGERQRILIARVLAQQSRIVLFDEPTSALDLKHQLSVYKLIRELQRENNHTLVVVTHDLNLASQFADRLVLLKNGRVAGQGTPDVILQPGLLHEVYEAELAYGSFTDPLTGQSRPWVLPWAGGTTQSRP